MSGVLPFLFDTRGRMRRRDWWLTTIAVSAAYYGVWTLLSRVFWGDLAHTIDYAEPIMGGPIGPLALNLALTAVSAWIQTAIGMRRLHDANREAWFFAIVNIVTVAISFAPNDPFSQEGFRDPLAAALTTVYWVSALASLYFLVRLGFADGTPGPNRFGRSPKGIGGDPADTTAQVFS